MDTSRPYRLNVLCYVYAGISSILPIRHVESRGGGGGATYIQYH